MSPTRKHKHISSDAMDYWLDTKGLYRKHTARDGSCLFRAVAEQLFKTQTYHFKVRKECVDFMQKQYSHYQGLIEGPFDKYIEKMKNQFQWGGRVELEAIGCLYECDVVVYHGVGGEPLTPVSDEKHKKKICLCFSLGNHYDSVYTKEHVANTAFCQSMVYEMLYIDVFGLTEIKFAVEEMLHSKVCKEQRFKEAIESDLCHGPMPDDLTEITDLRMLILHGITPFPYKVAKALDTEMYRNIEFDNWSDMRRELRLGLLPASGELYVGLKCLVTLTSPEECDGSTYHAYIQHIEPIKGPIEVFIPELATRKTVAHEQVRPLVEMKVSTIHTMPYMQLQAAQLGIKFRKLRQNRGRKFKENFSAAKSIYDKMMRDYEMTSSSCEPISYGQSDSPILFENIESPGDTAMQNYQSLDMAVCPASNNVFDTSTPQPGAGPHFVAFMPSPSGSSQGYYTASPTPPTTSSLGYYTASPSPPITSSVGYYTSTPSSAVASPDSTLQIYDSENNMINTAAPKSVMLDGSDISHIDKPTVRFFYNLGHDYFPQLRFFSTGSDAQVSVNDDSVNNNVQTLTNGSQCTQVTTRPASDSSQMVVNTHPYNMYVGCNCTTTDGSHSVQSYGYPMMYSYYQQDMPMYEYRPAEGAIVDQHQMSPQRNDTNQSLDSSGIYPYGLQFSRCPPSFLFHGPPSSGIYAPPPLNGVPYSPPPNGTFSIQPPPVTPVNSQTPWFFNQANTQSQ